MTAERDGKSRRTGQPDLLASLPDERPPASQPAPGIDPAAIEELVTGVRDLREQVAGLKGAEAADRPAPVPAALTPEALEAWGDKLVARVAEAARTADAPGGTRRRQLVSKGLRTRRRGRRRRQSASMGGWKAQRTGLRPRSGRPPPGSRRDSGLRATTSTGIPRLVHRAVEELRTRVAGRRFGFGTVLCGLDRLRPGHVAREPHTHPLQLAVSPMSRRRSASLPLARTGAALSGA